MAVDGRVLGKHSSVYREEVERNVPGETYVALVAGVDRFGVAMG